MLINLTEILEIARKGGFAVGAVNTPGLEFIRAAIDGAEELGVPVIISHAGLHEEAAPLKKIGPIMIDEAKRAKIPVCVHLDHCDDFEYMKAALELGFTGVMYDGSHLPYRENLENTKRAVSLASGYYCGVEAELGSLPSREGGETIASGPVYTDPDEAVSFCRETGINAFAPSFGTAHGIYKSKPVLDLELVKRISEMTGLPLVMHGGSGVSDEDYRPGIKNGLRKINYYSYMSKAATEAVRKKLADSDVTFYHDLSLEAERAARENVTRALRVFSGV